MRTTNQAGLSLIKEFEGCKLQAYQDTGGVWTIGVGHTKNVKAGDVITEAQAEAFLKADLSEAESCVNRLVKVAINDNQFAALVSLVFNIGCGAFASSHVLLRLNQSSYESAAADFMLFKYDNHVEVAGLVRRRTAEVHLFHASLAGEDSGAEAAEPESPVVADSLALPVLAIVERAVAEIKSFLTEKNL